MGPRIGRIVIARSASDVAIPMNQRFGMGIASSLRFSQ
jgi:hypothetical protein